MLNMTKPILYMLIGVPCSGKSTWVSKQIWAVDCKYISTDKYVEEIALERDQTYSEVFQSVMPWCVEKMVEDVINAREDKKNIIWDQTSTTITSRTKKFRMLPEYYKIAVVFRTPVRDELDVRLCGRPGKHIPKNVIDSMINNWEEPTLEEGFDEIWYAS